MSTPGVSLFQGTESIKLNNSFERAAEEEELEDARRRKEELENILDNAFDDLEEEETTVDSTGNFQSDLMEHRQQDNNHILHEYPHTNLAAVNTFDAEMKQLKLLLESRNRELDTAEKIAGEEKKKRDGFQKRLAIAEAELDRALASKKNTHELLVECKEKCSNLESTITKLKTEKKSIESENIDLLGKLETTQSILSDIQRKYDMVERDLNRHNDRNSELKRKHMEERHRAEIDMMQQQIDQMADKIDKKSSELDNINARYKALQNSHETMLLDKATKINDLNNALIEAQGKCEELLNKPDYYQENVRLQKVVANLQDQIRSMEKTITTLNERLQFTTAELDVMDSVLHQHNMEDTPCRLSPNKGRVVGSTPLSTVDRVGSLKDELYRALANVKNKREEIRRLQNTLEEKQEEIKLLKLEENKALVHISTLNDDKLRLENRLKLLEEESKERRAKSMHGIDQNKKIESLTKEVENLRKQKLILEEERTGLEKERLKYEVECKKLTDNLRNVEVDLEELKQEQESMKRNYEQVAKDNQKLRNRNSADSVRLDLEKHKFLLKDSQAECDRLKNLYVEISNAKEALSLDLEKLRSTDSIRQLNEQHDKIQNLQKALQLAELKSTEMANILEASKSSYEREISVLRTKLENERNKNLKEVKNSENNCRKCIEHLAGITKMEIENIRLKNDISNCNKEIDDLVQQITEAKNVILDLSAKLQLCDQQEKLIKELKAKAHQFEEYVRSQSSSSEKSLSPAHNQKTPKKVDRCVATTPELEKKSIKMIEARIRDEMAKIFAIEIKRFQVKLYQTEEQLAALQTDYKRINGELVQRQNEVDVLKQAIIAERESFTELVEKKESELKDKLQKPHLNLVQKIREELQDKNKKIAELIKELDDRQAQIEAERKSMKAVMSQWEENRQEVDAVEEEWKERMRDLQMIHQSAILSWKSKYNSAKQTAHNYKRYSDDKEAHLLSEVKRIKSQYDASLAMIEARVRDMLGKKHKELSTFTLNRGCEEDKENENKACLRKLLVKAETELPTLKTSSGWGEDKENQNQFKMK